MIALYYALYALTLFLALFAVPFHRKLREGFFSRVGLTKRIHAASETWGPERLWFHFSSSGEFEQCLPVLEAVKSQTPETRILLTYFSPSGKKAVRLESERRKGVLPWDHADYAPLDFPFLIRPLLKRLAPKRMVFINRELWPGLVRTAAEEGIPLYLISSFFSTDTQAKNRRLLPLFRKLRAIGTVDLGSESYLKSLDSKLMVETIGDPRVERVLARKRSAKTPWQDFFPEPVVLLASLRPSDLKALAPHLAQFPLTTRLILCPHEPSEKNIRACLEALSPRRARRWSPWLRSPDESSDLVIDTVGQLAELYRIASLVFVGGSFHRRVHNVLEPAAYGCPIFTGPFIQNSHEARTLQNQGALEAHQCGSSLISAMTTVLKDPEEQERRKQILASYLESETGAGKRYFDFLRRH